MICCVQQVLAGDTLRSMRDIPVHAHLMTMDELGNIYVIRDDNTLIRYNDKGDSTGFYRSVLNGDIGQIDATNPLRILLYYPAYAKVVLLDRMLSEKVQTDLRRQQILSAPAVATASDGRLWVYDPFNARLLKLDEAGEMVRTSNDLRQQISFVPNPSFILERDRRVYVCDSTKGLLIFDQFANYVNTIPLPGIRSLQAYGDQVVYRVGNELRSYDLKLMTEKVLPLPAAGAEAIIQAQIGPTTVAVLYPTRLVIYASPLR